MVLVRLWLWMTLWSMAGIFAHEIGHHLFGRRSYFSFQHCYPQEPATAENRLRSAIGSMMGPGMNLLLGYAGLLAGARVFAAANLSILFYATLCNLLVDSITRRWENDLSSASRALRIPVLIFPAVFLLLGGIPLYHLGAGFPPLYWWPMLFGTFFVAGMVLKLLDHLFHPRFRLI